MVLKCLPKKKRKSRKEGTPKFLYLLVFLAFASWTGWAYLLLSVPPDAPITRILFLGLLFLALFFTLAFLFYEAANLIKGGHPRELFLVSTRRALLTATFVCLTGAMKLLEIATLPNVGLLGLILLLAEIQLSRSINH